MSLSLADVLEWNVLLFLMIFSRLAGMIMLAPVFGSRGVPVAIKVALTGCLSLLLYPLIVASKPSIPGDLYPYLGVLIKEVFVGLAAGFVIYAFSAVIEGAGQLVDFQIGFTMSNTIDPVYGLQSPLMGNFQLILATMLLLATNAHHYLIAAMVKSYTYIPINPKTAPVNPDYWVSLAGNVLSLAVQLSLPVFGALLVADFGLGLLARAVPQMNVFSVVFPFKILFGFILLILAIPLFGDSVQHLFNLDMTWLLKLYQEWQK